MATLRLLLRKSLEKYPVITNSVIYGSFCVAAEFSQQIISRKLLDNEKPYDKSVIFRYSIYGTFIAGPAIANWYRFLDRTFMGTAGKTIAKKLLVDQFTFTPALLVVFYTSMSIMEGKSNIFDECKDKLIPTFKTSCLFWLPAQSVNFLLVPPIFRVTYISLCSFAWINILCILKRQQGEMID